MLLLGIDTSTKICTCSIYDSEAGVIAETSLSVKKNHSKISDLNIKDIDKIAVAIGPGSFTGVRIALGIAKGLAMALNKGLVAVNELDILEAMASDNENEIIPLIDARKERVYYKYQGKCQDDYLINLLSSLDKNKKYVFVGDGAINYTDILKENLGENAIIVPRYNSFPRASVLCELSLNREDANIYTVEPEYISKSRAEKNF